mmetsp:Transcript_24052/g.56517  ORF Transcript_24052/g.56517 Transcript_24052/m.56517 type:complete len:247 (-) Transcript_24052:986-1726(-)
MDRAAAPLQDAHRVEGHPGLPRRGPPAGRGDHPVDPAPDRQRRHRQGRTGGAASDPHEVAGGRQLPGLLRRPSLQPQDLQRGRRVSVPHQRRGERQELGRHPREGAGRQLGQGHQWRRTDGAGGQEHEPSGRLGQRGAAAAGTAGSSAYADGVVGDGGQWWWWQRCWECQCRRGSGSTGERWSARTHVHQGAACHRSRGRYQHLWDGTSRSGAHRREDWRDGLAVHHHSRGSTAAAIGSCCSGVEQ